MDYCTTNDVTGYVGSGVYVYTDLTGETTLPLLPAIITEASLQVYNDLAAVVIMDEIKSEAIPAQVRQLAIYKARELAFRTRTGATETSETINVYRRDYTALLDQIKAGYVNTGLSAVNKPNNPPLLRFM